LGQPGTLVLVSFDGLPHWLQNVSTQAVMLDLLSYTDKELTNSLLLAFNWLTILAISVWCWFDKERFTEENHNMTSKIPLLL